MVFTLSCYLLILSVNLLYYCVLYAFSSPLLSQLSVGYLSKAFSTASLFCSVRQPHPLPKSSHLLSHLSPAYDSPCHGRMHVRCPILLHHARRPSSRANYRRVRGCSGPPIRPCSYVYWYCAHSMLYMCRDCVHMPIYMLYSD